MHSLQATLPAGLSTTWKLLMRGGTCKTATFPCHCFSAKSSELGHFKVDDEQCDQCKLEGNERRICWSVLDNYHIEKLNLYLHDIIKDSNGEEMPFEECSKSIKASLKILS